MTDIRPIERESLLRELRELLGAPLREEKQLDGSIVMIGGDPGEVIVRVGAGKVTVAVFSSHWNGPYTSEVHPNHFATLRWRRLPAATLKMTLHLLVKAARDVRMAKYRRCDRCEEINPPEWMHDENTCQSCAEKYQGVAH